MVLVQVAGAVVIHAACGVYLLSQLGGSKKASLLACPRSRSFTDMGLFYSPQNL